MSKTNVNRPFNKPTCPECGSGQVYFRQTTKDHACRLCGKSFTLRQKREVVNKNKEKVHDTARTAPAIK